MYTTEISLWYTSSWKKFPQNPNKLLLGCFYFHGFSKKETLTLITIYADVILIVYTKINL